MSLTSRNKGKDGEREAAQEISRLFNVQARRGQVTRTVNGKTQTYTQKRREPAAGSVRVLPALDDSQ